MSRVMHVSSPDDDQPESQRTAKGDADSAGSSDSRAGRLSPALIATLVTIPVMVIVGFITFAALKASNSTPVPVDSYAAASTVSNECSKFLTSLPNTFDGFDAKQISGDKATWADTDDGDPIIVRCGVNRPRDFTPSSRLQAVNGVQWFITDTIEGRGQAYVCVDHRPYVAVWVPVKAGNASITETSAAIGRALTAGPLDFG